MGSGGAARRCAQCGQHRPPEHSYCSECGARLEPAILPANRKGFKQRGLGMSTQRILSRRDRRNEPAYRTWGDTVARWYFTLTLLVVLALALSARGLLVPVALWERARAVLLLALGP